MASDKFDNEIFVTILRIRKNNKTSQLQEVTLTPTISISNSSEDSPALNVNETLVVSKSAN